MPVEINSLPDLLARARAGDQDAARELHECFGPHILRVIRRKLRSAVRSKVDSFDLVQIVWLDFFSVVLPRHQFENAHHLLAFLGVMAVHVTQNTHRHYLDRQCANVRREVSFDSCADGELLLEASMDPAEIASLRDEWEHVFKISPPCLREALRRLDAGQSVAAISSDMGLHERTLRRMFQRLNPAD
jgi:DNA-directed RNA polymerase specialized sigma24 family protein